MRRPCSSHVYQVSDTPASIATSSRRSPGVRRRPAEGSPTCSGVTASRWARRNSASAARWSIPPSRPQPRRASQVRSPPGGPRYRCGVTDLALLLADLGRLVGVGSPSHDVAALSASAAELSALLAERTGRPASVVDGPGGPHVHWSGGGEPRVLILGHHDPVSP